MPYQLSWYHQNRVILVEIEGDMTLHDAYNYSNAIYDMVDSGTAPVHIIANLSKIGQFPPSLIALRNAARYLQHPKTGWIMLIGGPIMAQVFGEILTRLTKINYRKVLSVEEAAQFLGKVDTTLAGLEDRSG